ncbi:MAG TPA: triose-phosphate isomerase [bacterium]|nr:triose-phosphate isomerase [bacterium]
MSKTILIANWKMQLQNKEAWEMATELKNIIQKTTKNIEVILCPSFTALPQVAEIIKDSPIKLGAQNVFYHEKGSYTGEISPLMLKELGVTHVIVGHSERRHFIGETDADLNLKIKTCLTHNLTPIICIGETFDERRLGKTEVTIIRQLTRGLEDVKLTGDQQLIIAYEPVWAISPAPPAEPTDVKKLVAVIKMILADFFSAEVIDKNTTLIYGGSVDSNNINDFLEPNLITGALVGGASLNIEKFSAIINKIN